MSPNPRHHNQSANNHFVLKPEFQTSRTPAARHKPSKRYRNQKAVVWFRLTSVDDLGDNLCNQGLGELGHRLDQPDIGRHHVDEHRKGGRGSCERTNRFSEIRSSTKSTPKANTVRRAESEHVSSQASAPDPSSSPCLEIKLEHVRESRLFGETSF